MPTLRPATPDDAPAIARVHVASWRTTYRGVVPDEYLDGLSVERRETFWRGALEKPGDGAFTLVALDGDGGSVVGFAHAGATREPDLPYTAELYALYLLKSAQRHGSGRALLEAVIGRLLQKGFSSLMLWVLEQNPAAGFYAAMGGKRVASKPITIGGAALVEVAYGWDDLGAWADARA